MVLLILRRQIIPVFLRRTKRRFAILRRFQLVAGPLRMIVVILDLVLAVESWLQNIMERMVGFYSLTMTRLLRLLLLDTNGPEVSAHG